MTRICPSARLHRTAARGVDRSTRPAVVGPLLVRLISCRGEKEDGEQTQISSQHSRSPTNEHQVEWVNEQKDLKGKKKV